MKKSAFFAALLCAVSSGAYAASDVTLYGVVFDVSWALPAYPLLFFQMPLL